MIIVRESLQGHGKGRSPYLFRLVTIISFSVVLMLISTVCLAGVRWTKNGVAVRKVDGSDASLPIITPDGDGGAVITWVDDRNGFDCSIYTQRVDSGGNVKWAANGVEVCYVPGIQTTNYQVTSDGSGGAIVTWQDNRSGDYNIYAQRVDSGGNAKWAANGIAVCTVAGKDAQLPQITADGSGGAIIAWEDGRSFANWEVYAQRVDPGGNAKWAANGVAVCNVGGCEAGGPQVTSDGAGGAIMTWEDFRSGVNDIYANKVDSSGKTKWPTNGSTDGVAVREVVGSDARLPQITTDGSGGAVISWNDGRNAACNIYAQRMDSGGNPKWTANGVALCQVAVEQLQAYPITTDGSGGAIVTWQDKRSGDSNIYAQRVGSSGQVQWTVNGVAVRQVKGSDATLPRITIDGSGGAIVTWQDTRRTNVVLNYQDIYAQRVDSGGNTRWTTNGAVVRGAPAWDCAAFPDITTDGSGGAIVTWDDSRNGDDNVYAQRISNPSIAGCEPTSVVQGHTVNVDITGSHTDFKDGASTATFSGTDITVNSTDVTDKNHACANITVAPDAPVGHRDVNVTTTGETPEPLSGAFEVKKAPPPPHLDTLGPTSGTVGTHVLVGGEHFGDAQGQSYVTFNGTRANSYLSWSDGTVICPVPSGATTGPVTVTTPAGTSNGIEFTVVKPHVPKITDVSPNAVYQGDSGVDVTITGEYTHFKQGQSTATFSGTGIVVNSTTVTDSTHATANITAGINAPTGTRDVNVVTGSEDPAPLQDHFTVQPHGTLPPRLDGISPAEGTVGDQVTLSGGNFGSTRGTSQVTFNQGVPATAYSSWADGKILCRVPAGATTGPVTVTTTGGTSGGKTFTVGSPLIKDCEPKVVYQGHKVELDVLGEYTHFADGKSVMVVSGGSGVDVGPTYASDATHASANVTVAADATPGTRDVDVVTGSEHPQPLSNVLTVKKKPDNPPDISGLHPASGPVGTKVSVVGTNFGEARGSSTVTFSGVPVTNYVSWSGHDIILSVPLGAESGDVKVHTPWGTSGGLVFKVTDFTFYFAEGTTRPGFAPYLTIQNPDPADAKVKITYMLGDGTTREQDITVPATTRSTVTVTDTLGAGDDPAHDFSSKVECTNSQAIVAERPMYFDYGIHQGLSWTGGSDVIGALSPAESFFFAEGTCRPGFSPYLTIQNPNATDAQVKITYMLGDGTNREQDITVPATTRSTVTVSDTLGVGDDPAHDFSCKVESTNNVDIVAERPMYFSYGAPAGLAWTGGSDVVGALSPAEEFYFAEGTARPGFSPYLTIQNPAGTEAAVVITYMRGDGSNQQQALTVPATSRSTVTVADVLGSGNTRVYDFSAKVESTNNVDIIAERPMYFNYGASQNLNWTGGSDVVGALSPAGTFYFAEGTCRPGFAPYLTIQNPGLAHAQVKITYMLGDGTTKEQEVTVGAWSRYTVYVPDTLGVGDDAAHDFSCTVECTNSKRIIAERPMYFNYNGVWTGGSDVVGFSP